MEIISDNKNALFKRQELVFASDKNLSFDEARKEVAGKVGKGEDVVDVYNVRGGFGNQKFLVSAKVYDSKEDLEVMKNMELSKKKKKEMAEKGEEGGEAPVEEKSADESTEKPAEGTEGEGGSEDKVEEDKKEEEKSVGESEGEEKKEEPAEEEKKEEGSE